MNGWEFVTVIHTDVMDVPYHLLMHCPAHNDPGVPDQKSLIYINTHTGYFLLFVLFAIKTRTNIDTITDTRQSNDVEYGTFLLIFTQSNATIS